MGHRDPFQLLEDDYVTFLCVGLPKLLVGDALSLGFHMSRADVYVYERQGDDAPYHIVKFAFGLEIPSLATSSFAQPPMLVSNYDAWVAQVFEKIVVDVSGLLESNPDLQDDLQTDLDSLGVTL